MYLNVEMMSKYQVDCYALLILQYAKQQKNEDLGALIKSLGESNISLLEEKGFLRKIKGNSGQLEESKIRLTKKGAKVLDDIETPEILPEDLILFDWMSDIYLKLGKDIGNKKKTKMYIALFRAHSGIEKNCLATLLEHFVNDEDNMEYNMKLEFAFFKPTNVFQVKFDLDQSRLYTYYIKRKDFFDSKFEKLNKQAV
jgi:hypothetical protein